MRSFIFAALAAAAAATPMSALLTRQTVCVPPTANADGTIGPFKIQVGDGSAYAGNYAGTIPKRVNYIVFQYSNPASSGVADFYLTPSNNLIMVNGDVTQYAYLAVPPRYVSLSTSSGISGKIVCQIDDTTCALNCVTNRGQSTDCLGSPKVSPEWRIGNPASVRPECPAFQPVVVANNAVGEAASVINLAVSA